MNKQTLRVDEGGALISTDINGVPVDVRLDRDSIRINSDAIPGGGTQGGGVKIDIPSGRTPAPPAAETAPPRPAAAGPP